MHNAQDKSLKSRRLENNDLQYPPTVAPISAVCLEYSNPTTAVERVRKARPQPVLHRCSHVRTTPLQWPPDPTPRHLSMRLFFPPPLQHALVRERAIELKFGDGFDQTLLPALDDIRFSEKTKKTKGHTTVKEKL